jgi:hypothetical protein
MSVRLRAALLSLSAVLVAAPAAAARGQLAPGPDAASLVTSADSAPGPTVRSLAVGVRPQSAPAEARETLAQRRRGGGFGQSEALMIVGGAAVLVGAIVGDDPGKVIMVGGAVVFLYGLYRYLQQ